MAAIRQALILVGGRGTRLGALTDACPKPLLAVSGRPFLEYLLASLERQGVRKFVLASGYRAEMFRGAFPAGVNGNREIVHCIETTPAGTGGGVLLARAQLDETFLVLNGDTLFDVNCQALAAALHAAPHALGALALREVDDAGRYGSVQLKGDRIAAFAEKSAQGRGLINGGVYCLRRATLDRLPPPPCSLETDLFPALAAEGRLLGLSSHGYFIDIGLPETLARAQSELPAWERGRGDFSKP